jgi:hypothetical protein
LSNAAEALRIGNNRPCAATRLKNRGFNLNTMFSSSEKRQSLLNVRRYISGGVYE